MSRASSFKVVASSLVFAIVSSAGAQTLAPAPAGENSVQLETGRVFIPLAPLGTGSDRVNKMRERLQDPQQRAALREEHREYIVDSYYDVAEVLELDAATYDKLIELMTDQQMEQLDAFHSRAPSLDMGSHLQSQTERENREIHALRELLGQEKLERLQEYRATLGERSQVRELDAYLKSTDKLSRTQTEQLVKLFRAHNQRILLNQHTNGRARSELLAGILKPASPEELQRQSQLMTIEANEDNWRRTPESDRQLRDQAAAFLTAPQRSAFELLHADKLKRLQQSIEQMRVQAGLSPNMPAVAEAAEPTPAKVARDVRVRMKIAVNQAKPATFTEVVSSGKPFTFEVDEGLLVQVTPTVFDDDSYELQVEYFEQGARGRRSIGNMGTVGSVSTLNRAPHPGAAPMSSGTVVTGSKAYAIELSTSVEAI